MTRDILRVFSGRPSAWMEIVSGIALIGVMLLIGSDIVGRAFGSALLGHFVVISQIPGVVAAWTLSLPLPPHVIVAVILVIYLVGGSFVDDVAFMILATPIFFPVAMKLGYDPVWFSIVIGVTMMIGVITPPVAVAAFIVKNITQESIGQIYRGVVPFLITLVLSIYPGNISLPLKSSAYVPSAVD